jgi:hypothetical protein
MNHQYVSLRRFAKLNNTYGYKKNQTTARSKKRRRVDIF